VEEIKNSTKRIITYRVLAFLSEYVIIYVVSGNVWVPTIITPVCLLVHTGLHYLVEKKWKDNGEKSN